MSPAWLLLPSAAAGFWLGLLVAPAWGAGLGVRTGVQILLAGGVALVAMTVLRPRLRWAVVPAVVAPFLLMGLGWGIVRDAGIRASPSARLSGTSVRLWGWIEDEPGAGAFGWTASMRAERLLVPRPDGGG